MGVVVVVVVTVVVVIVFLILILCIYVCFGFLFLLVLLHFLSYSKIMLTIVKVVPLQALSSHCKYAFNLLHTHTHI